MLTTHTCPKRGPRMYKVVNVEVIRKQSEVCHSCEVEDSVRYPCVNRLHETNDDNKALF